MLKVEICLGTSPQPLVSFQDRASTVRHVRVPPANEGDEGNRLSAYTNTPAVLIVEIDGEPTIVGRLEPKKTQYFPLKQLLERAQPAARGLLFRSFSAGDRSRAQGEVTEFRVLLRHNNPSGGVLASTSFHLQPAAKFDELYGNCLKSDQMRPEEAEFTTDATAPGSHPLCWNCKRPLVVTSSECSFCHSEQ